MTVNGGAVSKAGARGLFQTMPATEQALKKSGHLSSTWTFNPSDLKGQVTAGLAALQEMSGRLKNPGDILELGAMYNGGTAGWRNYLAGKVDSLSKETRGYFDKLLASTRGHMTPQQIEKAAASTAPSSSNRGSSSSFSSRTNVWSDPELFANTMAAGANIVRQGGSVDSAISTISELAINRQLAEQEQMLAIQAGADAAAQAARDSYLASEKNAARRSAILQSANIHPDQLNNRIDQAFAEINQLDFELEPLARDIDQRQAVGIYDDPLAWLVNQVRLPGLVGEYNAGVRRQNRAITSAKELQALAGTQQSLSTAIDADVIAKAGVSKAAEVAAAAQEKLAIAQQQYAGTAARDAAALAQLEGGKFDVQARMLAFTKEVQAQTQGMSEKEAEAKEIQMRVDEINKYLKMIGSTQQHTTASYKLMPAQEREALFNAAGRGMIAPTFSEAATILYEKGNIANIANGGDAAVANWFTKVKQKAAAQAQKDFAIAEAQSKITGKPVKMEPILQANLDRLQAQFASEAADMSAADPDNPLKLDPVAASKNPLLEKNPVAVFLNTYGPASKNPVLLDTSEKKIFDRFTAAVVKGAMTPPQAAAAIHEFYTVGVREQALRTKTSLFGLPTPKTYQVKIPDPGFFSFSNQQGGTVDMLKLSSIEQYLTKNIAAQAPLRIQSGQAPYSEATLNMFGASTK